MTTLTKPALELSRGDSAQSTVQGQHAAIEGEERNSE